MEKLPEEMLRAVFVYLPGTDRLPVSLTCRRWFNLLKDSVPNISTVHISLDTLACSTRFLEAPLSQATLSICLCARHAQKHALLLQPLFQAAGNKLATLALEDNLIPKVCFSFIVVHHIVSENILSNFYIDNSTFSFAADLNSLFERAIGCVFNHSIA